MARQMLIRIEDSTKERLSRLARLQGRTTSQLLREIIDKYLEEQDIGAYIDDLWQRIGNKLKAKRVTPSQIEKAILNYRKKR
ncbi:MAG: ribbon-helix-helix protein, CopG family [Thermodesulfovibrionales bacterium]